MKWKDKRPRPKSARVPVQSIKRHDQVQHIQKSISSDGQTKKSLRTASSLASAICKGEARKNPVWSGTPLCSHIIINTKSCARPSKVSAELTGFHPAGPPQSRRRLGVVFGSFINGMPYDAGQLDSQRLQKDASRSAITWAVVHAWFRSSEGVSFRVPVARISAVRIPLQTRQAGSGVTYSTYSSRLTTLGSLNIK